MSPNDELANWLNQGQQLSIAQQQAMSLDQLIDWALPQELHQVYRQSMGIPRPVSTVDSPPPVNNPVNSTDNSQCHCGHSLDSHYSSLKSCMICGCYEFNHEAA